MMEKTKYTFLLPAYKSAFLCDAINSILAQTYKDFKLVILDDDSPENLYLIVSRFDSKQIEYHKNGKNMGSQNLVLCWNKLLSFAKTEYIILASDDDLYHPTFLEEIDSLTLKYPTVNLFRGQVATIDEYGHRMEEDDSFPEYLDFNGFIEQLYLKANIKCISNYVFKRESLIKANGFVEFPLAWYSDTATAFISSKQGVVSTNGIAFFFRLSGQNISSTKVSSKVAFQKSMAALLFHKWIGKHILELYSGEKKKDIKLIQYKDVKKMIEYHVFYCRTRDFLKLLLFCLREGIGIGSIVYKYCILMTSSLKNKLTK